MLTAPVEFLSDGKGWLNAARCVRMELGESDASGRRRPVPIQGSEFDLPLSVAVIAIGTTANPIVQSTTPGLGTNKRGYIQASEETQRTTRDRCVCWRGHRHRRGDRDSRHGRGTARGELDSSVSDDGRVVTLPRRALHSPPLLECERLVMRRGDQIQRLRAMNRRRM